MNKIEYRTKRIVIDSDALESLKAMESKRRVVNSHVNRLYKILLQGIHFDSPMVVNKKGEKYRLIDGNHRFEAIKKWIGEDTDRKIEVEFAVYDGLSEDEEKQVFSKWNSGRRQSSNDFVQMYQNKIPLLQSMLRSFPTTVRIYALQEGQRGVHFTSLLKAYLMAKVPFPGFKPYMGAAGKFVDDCIPLSPEDYQNLKDFAKFFENTLGMMEKDNPYQTTTMLNCIITLYLDNKELGDDALTKLFRRHILNRAPLLILGGSGGRTATENLYNSMRAEFSKGRNRDVLKFRNLGSDDRTGDMPATTELPVA